MPTTIAAAPRRIERASELLITATIGHHIDAAWNAKLKLLIGHTQIFLQVREGKRRTPALGVDGRKELNLKGFWVDTNADGFVFGAGLLGNELHRDEAGC